MRGPYERITWEPILGRYKFSWLKVRPKRRNWGYDWWEDDYYFSMEWLSAYDPDFVDQEVTDYWHNVLEDFSRGFRPILWQDKSRNFRPARVSAYKQPAFFKTFYWQRMKPLESFYACVLEPRVLGLATRYQELKYSVVIPGFVFRRLRRVYAVGQDPEDFYSLSPCYVYGRLDLAETGVDYLYLDTVAGRWVSMYWPWAREFAARFLLDFQHVSFISLWIDIRYRGFSPYMVLQRWRYFYNWLANLAFLELYTFAGILWLLLLHKRRLLRLVDLPSSLFCLAMAFCAFEYAGSFGSHHVMRDVAFDEDKDVLCVKRDEPRDWLLDELYEPSDTLHTHSVHGSDAGIVGQDELSFVVRTHFTAPLLLNSWWLGANETLAHFVYFTERDLVKRPRDLSTIRFSKWLRKKLPSVHSFLVTYKFPGFRRRRDLNDAFFQRYFGWWLNWRWHGWFWWGQPLKPMAPKYSGFFYFYEFFMGIEFYMQRYEPTFVALRDQTYLYIVYDWGVLALDDEEERASWVCYGKPVLGYVD